MRHVSVWLIGAAVIGAWGCGDGGGGPSDDEGARLAAQFERLADSVGGAGHSPTADALRHAAEIVRVTGHATPVTLEIDGASREFLAVAEQLDFPQIVCTWPDTTVADSGSGGGEPPPEPDDPREPGGECTEVGTYSMRTLIAWEPDHMAEVVRLVAAPGAGEVSAGVPDVMTGLPTDTAPGSEPPSPVEPPPGDSAGGAGPGFMGEYLVGEEGIWLAIEGSQANEVVASGGACKADRATFDWAEFRCESARFGYEFDMEVAPLRVLSRPLPPPDPAAGSEESHTISMARSTVDGVRLAVVAWVPPIPGPPPDSVLAEAR
jgi:hypothetical protein